MSTIQEALRPLFIMCFIMGLSIFPIKQSKSRIQWIHLSIIYSLSIWFAYSYLLYYTLVTFTPKLFFRTITNTVVLTIGFLTTIISVIINIYQQKRFGIYIKKLAAVDDTLEELGASKTYRKLYILSTGVVIAWIVQSLITNIYDATWWFNSEKNVFWKFLLPHLLNYSIHINTFIDFIFIFLLWYIGTRFDKVNEHMRYLLMKEEYALRCTWKKPVIAHQYSLRINNYKLTLWTSMHLHLELCRIAHELNSIFGTQIIFEMAYYLMFSTGSCYYLCLLLLQKHREKISINNFIGIVAWLLISLIKLYAINYICECVKVKANETKKIIYQLTNTIRYADVCEEINQFILQTIQHPLKFTGMGLFYFGNEFLQKFCVTIVMYVIIMVQMKIS